MSSPARKERARRIGGQHGPAAPTRTAPGESTEAQKRALQTPQAQQERKQRVLTRGHPAIIGSIADAVTIKNLDIFFLMDANGQVPLDDDHGFGLYFHDCRFLNGYRLLLAGLAPVALASTAEKGYLALFELANPDLHLASGQLMPKEQLGIRWERLLDAGKSTLRETLTFRNFGQEAYEFPVSLRFNAGFEDVFTVRELLQETLGKPEPPAWRDGRLEFAYHGADHLRRTVAIAFSPAPCRTEGTAAHFRIGLAPGQIRNLAVAIEIAEHAEDTRPDPDPQPSATFRDHVRTGRNASEQWLEQQPGFDSDSLLLNSIVARSLRDLGMLRSQLGTSQYFCAGVPWYAALFGRDSLIVAIEMLAFQPELAEQTLRLLARYQGRRVDDWRDERPGKILHELRVGELAGAGEIPHTPFYGTVDATPLFLLLLGRHAAWTGSLALFHELRASAENALAWIDETSDRNRDGYLEYESTSEKGLINQGWKDSGDAIVRADGTLAVAPIALVEVQGYVFAARRAMADLYDHIGETTRAGELRRQAESLRARFNRDFWWEEQGTYILALEKDGRRVAVVSSNPGHALWSGIADVDKGQRTAARLMADDMFSGWGVRTLSANERRYNPVGYHLGTVWPHDNALIAAGCRRYGADAAADGIFTGIVEAAMRFRYHRLPELFAGFRREDFGVPVHYPVSCHPQAWAAGAVPFLLTTCLGLEPDAFAGRLRVGRPRLPSFVDRIEFSGLRVGPGVADLRFQRTADGTRVEVLRKDALEIEIED